MEAEKFVNLSKKRAQDLAEANYMIFRLISVDGEPFFSYPEDIRTDRICVEVVQNKVVKAVIQ
jgi:hypothetical protein